MSVGWATSDYYYEIDLNNKYIDYRYDFEYFFPDKVNDFEKFLNNKTRKLIRRYKLTDDKNEEIKIFFKRLINELEINDAELNDLTESESDLKGISVEQILSNCYELEYDNGSITIKELDKKEELKQILKSIRENL